MVILFTVLHNILRIPGEGTVEMELEDCSRLQSQDKINLVIEMLITRSCGSIRQYCNHTVQVRKDIPPSFFFAVMTHLRILKAEQAKVVGPVQYGWMYFIERVS
ncbi:hypothetical protein C5167_044404 [Papaver somniferum]|uniref:DUF4218 domain-containing protein n=1 Tax=Papaver somniferum TaxID=3469 RepID=A0A4Y7L9B8_PAPSO|nr:hypothetical protein C5167_044404 [Papaver somniferum]